MRRSQLVGVTVVALAAAVVVPVAASAGSGHTHITLKSEKKISFLHNQGVAKIPGGWILTGTDKPLVLTDNIVRTDADLKVVARNMGAIPPQWRAKGYDHIGDIDVVGNTIYAPFEQPRYAVGHQVTAMYDVKTLAYKDAVVVPQHENSFVAIDEKTMTAYSMQHSDGSALTRYDVKHNWKRLPPLHMSRTLHHTQGSDIQRGYFWLSTSDAHNDIYRVDLKTGKVQHLGRHHHPGGEGEGIDATILPSGDLHALILDPSQRNIWFENFDVVHGAHAPRPTTSGVTGTGSPSGSSGSSASGSESGSSSTGTSSPATGSDLPERWPALVALVAAFGLVRLTHGLRRRHTSG